MESDFDTTGIITKISDDFSVVTVTINDVPRSFSFSKYLLYVFGLQCEGQMANILEEGMEVDVRYRLSNENVPSIVAVWISEKPDHLSKDCALKPFYEQKGKVIDVNEDNVLVRIDGSDHTVLISKEVFFRDGYRTKSGSGLLEGETVAIDAIPFESEHPTGASYQATCAWVGPAPILVERFGLGIVALDDPWDVQDPMELVHGIVTAIPNEVLAFAEMGCVQQNGKVLLFRSSFAVGRGNIKDLINVGDSLCMRIRYEYVLDGSKQVYAAQAWKDGCEADSNEMPRMEKENLTKGAVDNLSAATVAADSESILSLGDKSDEVGSQKAFSERTTRKRRTRRRQKESQPDDLTGSLYFDLRSERDEDNTLRTETGKLESMEKDGVLFNNPPLSGVISIISQDEAYILHNGVIHVDRKTMFKDGKPLTDDREYVKLVAPGDQEVFFEAVKKNSKTGFTHEATCVWVGKKPSLKLTRTGNSPEHQVEININRLSHSKTDREAVKLDESGDVLTSDPPLSGPITLTSRNTAYITYQGYKIFVRCANMYVDGQACAEKLFVLALTTSFTDVNFEAVKLSPERYKDLVAKRWLGFTHEATCAWVGRKPLSSIGSSSSRYRYPEPVKAKQTDPAKTAYKTTETKFTASSPVLYCEDHPLEGILIHDTSAPEDKYMTFDSVCISFGGLKVFLDCNIMYYKGTPCSNETILDLISRDISHVNFEAVKTNDCRKVSHGFSHEATLVWVGQRPGLFMIAKTLPPMRFHLLDKEDRTYRGVVRRFCLPKVALVCDSKHDHTVSLHVSAFGRKPKQYLDFASGKDCISSFVKLNDVVEFNVTRVSSFAHVLSATNVKIVSTNTKTSDESPLCHYPEKSTSNEMETSPIVPNSNQKTKLGMADGLWSPYPQFDTPSLRKEALVEAKLNQDAEEVSAQSFTSDYCRKVSAVFPKAFLYEGKTVGIDAKEETRNSSLRSLPAVGPLGLCSLYSRFELPSVQNEVPIEANKFTNQEVEEETSPGSFMGSNYPGVKGTLEKALSDKGNTDSIETKREDANSSVPSPLTERPALSCEDIPIGVDALSEEKRNAGNFGKLSAEPTSVSISKSTSQDTDSSTREGISQEKRFPREAKEETGVPSGHSQKRSPESKRCSVM